MAACEHACTSLSTYLPAIALLLAAGLAGWYAYQAKIAEFRQKWINELRSDIADLLSYARRYHLARDSIFPAAGLACPATSDAAQDPEDDQPPDESALRELEHEMDPIYNRIELRINPRNNLYRSQDLAFLNTLKHLLRDLPARKQDPRWPAKLEAAMAAARELLKREWEVTKSPLPGEWSKRLDESQRRGRL